MSKVAVFGSFVVDLMARSPHLPVPGETVKGSMFKMGPGGKGFNQCVAAHKAGAEVVMITKVGRDSFANVALDTMTELSATIRDSFGLYLNKTASDLIDGITGGIYNSMSVDENLNIFMNTRTKLVPVDQVSSGTMDQVYLALRLAAARLIPPEGAQMPLIFDDSFVLYDDERLRTALKWLAGAYSTQIIIFTCHRREAQMLTANQIGYHLINM